MENWTEELEEWNGTTPPTQLCLRAHTHTVSLEYF